MSNYPAGVTGHEPAISGYDTRDVSVECFREDVSGVPTALVMTLLNQIEQTLTAPYGYTAEERVARALHAVQRATAQVEAAKGEHVECGFEGDVEASVEHGTLYWTCPWCDTEHEDNVE